MSPRPPNDGRSRPRPLEIAIVGNDLLLAAFPARPVQLSHAILACGYDHVVPVSWGEEIVAEHTLRALAAREHTPVIVCACSRTRARLLASGPELERRILTLVAPSVATARYLRAMHPGTRLRITYIGDCDTHADPAINAILAPTDFLRRLAERGISAVRQPAVFESIIPPDRRRHYSRPGGVPAVDALARRAPEWQLTTVGEGDFSVSLAELLLSGEPLVIDVTELLGCQSCSGRLEGTRERAVHDRPVIRLAELEPPRSPSPILDHDIEVSVAPTTGSRQAEAMRSAPTSVARERAHAGDSPIRQVSPRSGIDVVATIEPATASAALVDAGDRSIATRRLIAITPSSVSVVASRAVVTGGARASAHVAIATHTSHTSHTSRSLRLDAVTMAGEGALGTSSDLRAVTREAPRVAPMHEPRAPTSQGYADVERASPDVGMNALRVQREEPSPVTPSTPGADENAPRDWEAPVAIPVAAEGIAASRRRRSAHAAFHAARVAALARAAKEGGGHVVRTFASRRFTPTGSATVVDVEASALTPSVEDAGASDVVEVLAVGTPTMEVEGDEEVDTISVAGAAELTLDESVLAAVSEAAPEPELDEAPEEQADAQADAKPQGEAVAGKETASDAATPLSSAIPVIVRAPLFDKRDEQTFASTRGTVPLILETAARSDAVLAAARVRPSAHRPARPEEPTDPPSLGFYLIIALGVVAAIVALALILRRNPFAPS